MSKLFRALIATTVPGLPARAHTWTALKTMPATTHQLDTVTRMLATTHTCVGFLVGQRSSSAPQALALGVGSHLLLDRVPHWGGVSPRAWTLTAILDGLTAGTLAVGLLAKARPDDRLRILAGIIGANLPDADKPIHLFTRRHLFPRRLRRLLAHGQKESPRFALSDLSVAIAALALADARRSA